MINPKVLRTKLAVIGHIKIGRKGPPIKNSKGQTNRYPQKLDHFEITSNMRDANDDFIIDQEIHKIVGEKPLELGIMLLYNDLDLTFRTSLAKYQGRKAVCQNRDGGEIAKRWDPEKKTWFEVPCPCQELSTDENPGGQCKPHGKLSCLLECSNTAGGVYVFDTTSWNSISSIQGSLEFLRGATCGRIAGIPIRMVLNKKQTNVNGQNATIYFVNLTYKGNSRAMLEDAVARAKEMITAGMDLKAIEQEAKLLLTYEEADGPLSAKDVPEFYPDAQGDEPAQVQAAPEKTPDQALTELAGPDPKAAPEQAQKALRFFVCHSCGNVHTVRDPIDICEGCGSTALEEQASLKPAGKITQPAQETKPTPAETKPPAQEPIPPKAETKPASAEPPATQILADLIRKEFQRLSFNGARKTLHIKVTLGRPMDLEKIENPADLTKILESLKKLK